PAGPVAVYEIAKNATFEQMFGSLSENVDTLCFTGAQIIEFCRANPDKLRQDDFGTFFLRKSKGKLFVVLVDVIDGGPRVRVYRFADGGVWHARYRRRVVVPQIV